MKIWILGAGPAGMAIADALADDDRFRFVLLERDDQLGGLARTVTWPGVGTHDLGPHKIFTLDQQLMQRVEALLPASQWLTRDKLSRIYINGRFLPYPPSPFSLASVFGVAGFAKMSFSYGMTMVRGLLGRKEPKTFEADLLGRVGNSLYQILFKPIALKLWGDPNNLDVKLSRGRVQTPSLLEIAGRMLGLQKTSQFEALTFRYPKGGLGTIWQAIRERTKPRGQILLEHAVTGLDISDGRVSAIHCQGPDKRDMSFSVAAGDFVVSTLPLGMLIRLLAKVLPQDRVALARDVIVLNDLLLVFLHIDQPNLFPEAWIFVPDAKVAFHRVSEQESFDPGMTPNGSIVCCEIMSNEMRDMSARSDEELVSAAERGLREMGYTGWKTLNRKVVRLPKSYPVFRPGFEQPLADLLAHVDAIKNLRTVGRQGSFNYIGTLDAMDMGYGVARWLRAGAVENTWPAERDRTNHYPVLD